jgi:hypothetical protein
MGKSFKAIIIPESQKDILDLTIEDKEHNNTGVTSNTKSNKLKNGDLRRTFVITVSNYEGLKKYVHTRRVNGDTEYSQKNALSDALELLFNSSTIL